MVVDDVGRGRSSLAYAGQLPVDKFNVNRSFFSSMAVEPEHLASVRATVQLGRALGLSVLAEGVQDEPAQAAYPLGPGRR